MYTQVWKKCHASVCQLSFINARGVCVDTLTGFKVKNYLITSHNAFTMDKAQLVEIAFVGEDANTVTASMRIPYAEFNNEHRIGVLNNNGYYAVYEIDFKEFQKIPGLQLSKRREFTIGSQVVSMVFCCGLSSLSLRQGYISSLGTNNDGNRFIHVDGHLSYGNGGAPLIDPQTLEVIGILTYRDIPATSSFKQIIDAVSFNLQELKKVETSVKFGEIDPIQVLIANQNQLKLLAKSIYKYSMTNHPMAVTLDRIITFFDEDMIYHSERTNPPEEESDIFFA